VKRVRVKICGITRVEDAQLAARLGADALGLVFYPGSRRAVDIPCALDIRRVVPAFVSLVGLFVNPDRKQVTDVISQIHLDCLQFHGEEDARFCSSFGLPYMKAIRVREGQDPLTLIADHKDACAILLDAYDPREVGGTGQQFDWEIARRCVLHSDRPIVLAGGIRAENAARAIRQVTPWALDLSSGVETVPGLKDPVQLQSFFDEVNRVRI